MKFSENATECINDIKFIEMEIKRFIVSKRRKDILDGERYYIGKHDILRRKREVIGVDGKIETVDNLPNNKIVDNQYRKMVNQKNNYLLGKPIAFDGENKDYISFVNNIFNMKFNRLLKNVGEDSLNCGIGWLYVYYNGNGELSFKRFKPQEIIPGWADAEHTVLDYAIRLYEVVAYEGINSYTEKIVTKVEVYDKAGISFYEYDNGNLISVEPYHQNNFTISTGNENIGYNWSKIPIIPFKYNREIPLIKMVRSLQDGLNMIESNFQNHMQEDQRNTILVLVNYDGENLGEFRKNLAEYGAVKVNTVDKAPGDVRTLQVEVNSENYKTILDIFKKAMIENAMGYDAKDDRLGGNANQMNIQSMYSDIDLDANAMETEFQASFEELFWFLDNHFFNVGLGDFYDDIIKVVFNRDILINETEVIENCTKSMGILSDRTIVTNHPWIDNPLVELDRIAEQKQAEINEYSDAFAEKVIEDE